MKTLGQLLRTAARTDILRILSSQTSPIGVRHLARLADVYPRSAEVALRSLTQEGLVKRTLTESRALYTINPDHPSTALLHAVFEAAAHSTMLRRNKILNRRAMTILPFIQEATELLRHTRSMQHAT